MCIQSRFVTLLHLVDIENGNILSDNPVKFTVVRHLSDIPMPAGFSQLATGKNIKVETNERGLLGYLLGTIVFNCV